MGLGPEEYGGSDCVLVDLGEGLVGRSAGRFGQDGHSFRPAVMNCGHAPSLVALEDR